MGVGFLSVRVGGRWKRPTRTGGSVFGVGRSCGTISRAMGVICRGVCEPCVR